MASTPTNAVLAQMIQGLTQEFRDGHTTLTLGLARVETKADLTNGRIRKLEAWKYAIMGALTLLNLIAVPIMVNWLQSLIP